MTAMRMLLAAVVWSTAMAGPAFAQMFVATGPDTLRSLPGIEVAVEPLAPELERPGLSAVALRTAVESQLRAAGIPLYATQQQNPSPAKAYLYVDVTGVRMTQPDVLALSLQVQVRQTLRSLVTESNIVDAMTWDARTVLVVPSAAPVAVLETVREYVGQFIRDWTRVHEPGRDARALPSSPANP